MTSKNETRVGRFVQVPALALMLLLLYAAPASAAGKWLVDSQSNPTAQPGDTQHYLITLMNTGDAKLPVSAGGNAENCVPGAPAPADPSRCFRFRATFPAGLTPLAVTGRNIANMAFPLPPALNGRCAVAAPVVECAIPGDQSNQVLAPNGSHLLEISAAVEVGSGRRTVSFELEGAGAAKGTSFDSTLIQSTPAEFGLGEFDGQVLGNDGSAFVQAGGHPASLSTVIELNSFDDPDPAKAQLRPVEPTRSIFGEAPPGLIANPTAYASCTAVQLANTGGSSESLPLCPPASQVGTITLKFYTGEGNIIRALPLFSMEPAAGSPARFGFATLGVPVVLDAKLRSSSDYGVSLIGRNVSEGLPVQTVDLTLWGDPADESHRPERACPGEMPPTARVAGESCPAGTASRAFLRMPTSCTSPNQGLEWVTKADSYWNPGAFDEHGEPDLADPDWDVATYVSHESPGWPAGPEEWGPERGVEGCEDVRVRGDLAARPTSVDTETSSGLSVHLEVPNPGLDNPKGIASSDLKKVRATLPQGVTINPSQAEGLGTCSLAEYESTELSFHPTDKGCPSDSKIGTVEVKTPLLEEEIPGEVFIAEQGNNPFGSLLAIYVVLAEPQRGVLVKLPGLVETDEQSGRIVTTFDDLPQVPFDTFDFKFREGARAPLVTPPTCGTYETTAEIWGHSDPEGTPFVSTSSFEITRGIGGGPCPDGAPGFDPGFSAGTVNNAAGAFSPTLMRLTRRDGEQNLTKFSATLAPGLLAKLAGVERCPDAGIAAAATRSGRDELAVPSCPAGSRIGRTMAGAGVGSVLTYVPGSLYLAGPYNGAPLSVVAITPAVAGPFDVGTVVVREALDLDPKTGIARVDGSASDPIPHILQGIPLKLRDLRVYVDRENFTLNPTSCDPSQVGATLWGSAADVFSPADDVPVDRASRFQAANCAALGFRPRLRINLKGGTRRSKFPALRAELTARPGDANIGRVRVALPHSEFLAQAHLGTSCTRVQFAAGAGNGAGCPANSVYGYARAWTPLLDEPLEGPVFLRSNGGERELPDLVAALRGLVDIELEGWIDSTKDGGIRTTFQSVPDAPVTKFVLSMKGGKKGLLENSTNICRGKHRATVEMDGQNGKIHDFRPLLKPNCSKKGRKGRR
jgi:hypothetical protein